MENQNNKAVLIGCFDHYAHRFFALDDYLKSRGFETTYITSDFDHMFKKSYQCKVSGAVQLHARPYYKNLSLDRILSHRNFARDAFRYLESLPQEPAVVAVQLPPNFLAHYAAAYKRKHPNVKLIFDVFDLWPETFPSGSMKKLLAPAFAVWAWIRDHALGAAEFVTTECEMFRNRLKLANASSATVYLCAKGLTIDRVEPQLCDDKLEICYLGSINNIISIPDICGLIRRLSAKKPVVLHIIGKGEREQEFIDEARNAGAEVIFYGPVYDDETKMQIMSKCRFGLNVMKSSVCIGLTMKSLDYFRFGLPIINNIPADTQQMVLDHCVGVQLDDDCAEKILSLDTGACLQMRRNVTALFDSTFDYEVIMKQYASIFDRIL